MIDCGTQKVFDLDREEKKLKFNQTNTTCSQKSNIIRTVLQASL